MKIFHVELIKIIVVSVEGDDYSEEAEKLLNDDEGFDGAWDRAEVQARLLYTEKLK